MVDIDNSGPEVDVRYTERKKLRQSRTSSRRKY